MPRTNLGKKPPEDAPVDWNLAAILERKKRLKLEWADIAEMAGMSSDALRNMVSRKRTDEWEVYTLKKVLMVLGLEYRAYLVGSPEDKKIGN